MTDILSRLKAVKQTGSNQYLCLCPAHNDKKSSLTITVKNDKTLLHCHAGCTTANILSAVGLELKDLFADKGYNIPISWREKIKTFRNSDGSELALQEIYPYTDIEGNVMYYKLRYETKEIRYCKVDGNNVVFKGVTKELQRQLYNNTVFKSLKNCDRVYIVEGEKDVNTLTELDMAAVTPGAVGDWREEFAELFKGLDVVILEDNDAPGKKFAETVQKSLIKYAAKCRIVTTSQAEHGDVTDYLFKEGHTKQELLNLIESTENKKNTPKVQEQNEKLKFISFTESLENEPIIEPSFLIDRLIYKNGINLISGDPKTYKTYVAIDIAISIIANTMVFDNYKASETGNVVFISPEFDTRKRFIELSKSRWVDYKKFNNLYIPSREQLEFIRWSQDKDIIVEIVKQVRPVLLVLDPLSYIFDGEITKNEEVTELFRDLKKIIKDYGTTILLTHHNNRMNSDKRMNNVSGASAITRFADCIIYLEKFKEDEEQDIFKSDDELDKCSKDIKLIKGVYRHGGEGYKYHKISFKFDGDSTDISSERHSNKEENGIAVKNIPKKDSYEIIQREIIKSINEGKLPSEFTKEQVLTVIDNKIGKSDDTFEKYVKETLSSMVSNNKISSIRGKGYTLQTAI